MRSFGEFIKEEIDTVTYCFWCPNCGFEYSIWLSQSIKDDDFENHTIACEKCETIGYVYWHDNSVWVNWSAVMGTKA